MLFCQFALRRAGQCDIGRLKVAARLQDDPVRAVLDKQDLGAADQQRAGSHMHKEAALVSGTWPWWSAST